MIRKTTPTKKTPRKTEPEAARVAFLGLGAMGAPMAANLARAGFTLAVWNRTSARARPFARLGARIAATPADCVADADVVITMVRDAAALKDVMEGPAGILAGIRRRALVIDMSTIGRAAAVAVGERVRAAQGRFIDAPVSGTVQPATSGDLLALVGGRVRDVAAAQPVLDAMCKRVIHAGDVGQGQALKVVVNGLGVHHLVAFTSMLALAERAGLARDVAVDAFTSGAFASPSYVGKRSKVLARDFSPEFSLDLTLKDARLSAELQAEVGMPLGVHDEIRREVEAAVAQGLGAEDLFALEKFYARRGA